MILPILVVAWESQQGSGGSPPARLKPTMSLCSHLGNGLLDLVSNAKALGYPSMHVFCPQEITLQPSSQAQPPTSLWKSRRFQQLNIFLDKRSSQVPPTHSIRTSIPGALLSPWQLLFQILGREEDAEVGRGMQEKSHREHPY